MYLNNSKYLYNSKSLVRKSKLCQHNNINVSKIKKKILTYPVTREICRRHNLENTFNVLTV